MSQVFQLLLWIVIVFQLLQGVRIIGAAADLWEETFQADYALMVCGRYRAMAANLRDAATLWRKVSCAEDPTESEQLQEELHQLLLAWRGRYPDLDLDACGETGALQVRLHKESNPELDTAYPNWVALYHE